MKRNKKQMTFLQLKYETKTIDFLKYTYEKKQKQMT